MIHGDICRPLFEVTHRVASRRHHTTQQLARFRYRTCRTIDKARLHSAPGFHEAGAIFGRERTDVKRFDALRTPLECRFRMPPATVLLHGPSIFGASELSLESLRPALSEQEDCSHDGHDYDDQSNNQCQLCCVQSC
jgi:hypothetical protein